MSPEPTWGNADLPLVSGERSLAVDQCFSLLANRRRRFCLYLLIQVDRAVTIHEMALFVEAAITPEGAELTDRAIEETKIRIIHNYLPRLREHGIVCVKDGSVRLGEDPELPVIDILLLMAPSELPSEDQPPRDDGQPFPS